MGTHGAHPPCFRKSAQPRPICDNGRGFAARSVQPSPPRNRRSINEGVLHSPLTLGDCQRPDGSCSSRSGFSLWIVVRLSLDKMACLGGVSWTRANTPPESCSARRPRFVVWGWHRFPCRGLFSSIEVIVRVASNVPVNCHAEGTAARSLGFRRDEKSSAKRSTPFKGHDTRPKRPSYAVRGAWVFEIVRANTARVFQ
jgi:hypothetical protein